ncbi:MAG: VWA domain-containing protein [Candidatus Competibacteraceae bacterium]
MRDIILCVDQSGSMAASVVYSGIMAAVMASIRAVHCPGGIFDTAVVDLTEQLTDPVEVLFGTQPGRRHRHSPGAKLPPGLGARAQNDTILVLISDLYEGGDRQRLLQRAAGPAGGGRTVNRVADPV